MEKRYVQINKQCQTGYCITKLFISTNSGNRKKFSTDREMPRTYKRLKRHGCTGSLPFIVMILKGL